MLEHLNTVLIANENIIRYLAKKKKERKKKKQCHQARAEGVRVRLLKTGAKERERTRACYIRKLKNPPETSLCLPSSLKDNLISDIFSAKNPNFYSSLIFFVSIHSFPQKYS